jgi:hypothetical protein
MGNENKWIHDETDTGGSWIPCFATARVNADVGFSDDRGKYRVNAALHCGNRLGSECFIIDIQLVDRATWKPIREVRERFDTLDQARHAIGSFDPCDCISTLNGDASNPDVRQKLSTHYQSQKAAWDREIKRVFSRAF